MGLFSTRSCICRPCTHCVTIWTRSPQQGDQAIRVPKILPEVANISVSGVLRANYCGVACLLLRMDAHSAVSNLRIRRARCKSGYIAPEGIYQATELVRNRITPLGGRQQCRLVVYTQNSSGIKCTPPDTPPGALPPGPPLGLCPRPPTS